MKLTRDYRLVEQQYKNVQLDVKRKRGLTEARQREAVRMEEEEKERKRRGNNNDGFGGSGDDVSEGAMRWQMQIQEDVSSSIINRTKFMVLLFAQTNEYNAFFLLYLLLEFVKKINEEIMREREEEIKNIHKGMHTVNEIYKVWFCIVSVVWVCTTLC